MESALTAGKVYVLILESSYAGWVVVHWESAVLSSWRFSPQHTAPPPKPGSTCTLINMRMLKGCRSWPDDVYVEGGRHCWLSCGHPLFLQRNLSLNVNKPSLVWLNFHVFKEVFPWIHKISVFGIFRIIPKLLWQLVPTLNFWFLSVYNLSICIWIGFPTQNTSPVTLLPFPR